MKCLAQTITPKYLYPAEVGMFKADFVEMCADKYPLLSMRGTSITAVQMGSEDHH